MLGRRPPLGNNTFRSGMVGVVIAGVVLTLSSGALGKLEPGWSAGKTSQHGVVRVYMVRRQIESLIIELRTH